ncbi:MAG: cytochrome c [Verrucomicrobia bacterium]|nr:cytochrome c [Cytophagales bacterium]
MKSLKNIFLLISVATVVFTACNRNPNDPGTEYAPDMYHAVAYEPLSQITDSTIGQWRTDRADGKGYYNSNPINPNRMNMRYPVKGTVSRRNYQTTFGEGDTAVVDLMVYNIPKDSMGMSERMLLNPVPLNDKTLKEGEVLYTQFCQHCHGKDGKGGGSVAEMYKGVPNYTVGNYKTMNGGHIYHTITHGKGRMWPHGGQIAPTDRWKIVHYVHKLQNQ